MKQLSMITILTASALATGCSLFPMGAKENGAADTQAQSVVAAAKSPRNGDIPANQVTIMDDAGSVLVQKVEFRPGVSSASVERMGKRFGCNGRTGAGLVTDKGPVEVYRMQCENGTTFMAQCELRQCRPMR